MNLSDELLEGRRGGVARVGERVRHDALDSSRVRGEHDNALGQVDRLGNVVRDDEKALEALQAIWDKIYGAKIPYVITLNDAVFSIVSELILFYLFY